MYIRVTKPLFDFLISLTGLLVLSPLIFVLFLFVYYIHGNPVLFSQLRPGKNGVVFKLYKFRTMTNDCDSEGELLPDNQRISRLGTFLRNTSLDEIPQLLNVLKGEISLVGPRPLLVEYLPLYNENQKKRHLVKPGITGWAQVNGRNAITWEDKFKMDLYYVENISFKLDLIIIFRTIKKVIMRTDINSDGGLTMERFKGSLK